MSTDQPIEKPKSAAESRLRLMIIAGCVIASPIVVPLLDGTVTTKRQFKAINQALQDGPRFATHKDNRGSYNLRLSAREDQILVDSLDFACEWLLDADKKEDGMIATKVTPLENCQEHSFSLQLAGDEIVMEMGVVNYGTIVLKFAKS